MERTVEKKNTLSKIIEDTKNTFVFTVEQFTVAIKNKPFDQAMDANYIETHIGGGNHRLFDGGHDILGAWKAAGTVTSNNKEKVIGWLSGLWNDLITPKGLPFVTITPEQYEYLCNVLKFMPRNKVYDMLSYTPMELLGIGSTIPTVVTKCKKSNVYVHSSVASMLTVITVRCSSIPAGILATIQIIKVAKTCKENPSATKEAASGFIATLILGAISLLNAPLGIALGITYSLSRSPKLRNMVNNKIANLKFAIKLKFSWRKRSVRG